MNELRFEGLIERITPKNEKIVKFTSLNMKNKRIIGTEFSSPATRHIYEEVEQHSHMDSAQVAIGVEVREYLIKL